MFLVSKHDCQNRIPKKVKSRRKSRELLLQYRHTLIGKKSGVGLDVLQLSKIVPQKRKLCPLSLTLYLCIIKKYMNTVTYVCIQVRQSYHTRVLSNPMKYKNPQVIRLSGFFIVQRGSIGCIDIPSCRYLIQP